MIADSGKVEAKRRRKPARLPAVCVSVQAEGNEKEWVAVFVFTAESFCSECRSRRKLKFVLSSFR